MNSQAEDQIDPEILHFICHEFKNPLFGFKTILTYLKEGQSLDSETIDEVLSECRRTEQFINALLDHPTPGTLSVLKSIKDSL